LQKTLMQQQYHGQPLRVKLDDRDINGGEKTWSWIKKGVPIRLEIGPRDMANNSVFMGRRDLAPKDKKSMPLTEFVAQAPEILEQIQITLFTRAKTYAETNTRDINNLKEFEAFFTPKNSENPEIHGGFARCFAIDAREIEDFIKPLKVTARCILLDQATTQGTCIFTGKPTTHHMIFAKSY
jgi:prolyl-tRNA synthetase